MNNYLEMLFIYKLITYSNQSIKSMFVKISERGGNSIPIVFLYQKSTNNL